MSTGVFQNFETSVGNFFMSGIYRGGVVREQACGYGVFIGEGMYAGYRLEGEWKNNTVHGRGALQTKFGTRYFGEFDRGHFPSCG